MATKQSRKINEGVAKKEKAKSPARLNSFALYLSAILLFTAILYSKAIFNDLTYYDDDYYILGNPFLRDQTLHGIKAIFSTAYGSNYHPLTTMVWFVLFSKFHFNPIPYHLVNVVLHLLNTLLAYIFIKKLSKNEYTSLIVAFLFAIHPMHVESVVWATELKDVLYAAFFLSSLIFYLKFQEKASLKYYAPTLLLFICSLLSKPAAVTLPVALIAIDLYKNRKTTKLTIIEKIPFFLLSLCFGILTIHTQSNAISNLSHYGFINRIFLFTYELAFYFVKLVCPYPLSGIHFLPPLNGHFLPWSYYASLPILLLIALIVVANRGKKYVLFGLSFFLITISVMLQVVPVGFALVAERYTYVPYIGLFFIVGECIGQLNKQKLKPFLVTGSVLIAVLFSVGTWHWIGVWKNSDTLFSDIINKNKENSDNCFIYWSWGNAKKSHGKMQEAYTDYTEAILRYPKFFMAFSKRGEVYNALGRPKLALQDYNQAILLKPDLGDAYNNRGSVYLELGDTQAALQDFNKAILLKDDFIEKIRYPETYDNRGWLYYCKHDTASAMQDFNRSISLDPYFSMPYYNIAAVYINKGDVSSALDMYSRLLKVNQNEADAYNNRGIIRYNLKDATGACEDWNKATELGNKQADQYIRQYCK